MKNILVVPCGTEIGLEVNRALKGVKGIKVIGLNSVTDSAECEYEHFYSNAPFLSDTDFIPFLTAFVNEHDITHVIPAHDDAALLLSQHSASLGCKVITSSQKTNEICRSKKKTYHLLESVVSVPATFQYFSDVSETDLPVFVKPDVGQGSKGAHKVESLSDLEKIDFSHNVVSEFLPGKEYTVDCYTSASGKLKYAGPRVRTRISNGIAVGTQTVEFEGDKFAAFADKINSKLDLKGAWFFQVKEKNTGELVLMEVATRIAGSMSTNRVKGVNFAELSLYAHDGIEVDVVPNYFQVTQHRNLSNKYKINIDFNHIYVDFDDCLVIDSRVNTQLLTLLYKSIAKGCKVHLVTRHEFDIYESLKKYRLESLFDSIFHITDQSKKSSVMEYKDAIFIDDSFRERADVMQYGIPSFSVDSVEALL